MKKVITSLFLATVCLTMSSAQSETVNNPLVDYDGFELLVKEVKEHRKERLITQADFIKMSKGTNVIILDTRSEEMYKRKHIKGAIHLDFSDFTVENLSRIIPNPTTKILIYCNNNFLNDQVNFASKSYVPPVMDKEKKPITLALNIPTYINLYGYGYRNIFELSELIPIELAALEFEGTDVHIEKSFEILKTIYKN
jgi:hypothetical protein